MKRNYFVVVLAHPVYGRIKRIHIPHYVAHLGVCLALLAGILAVGFASSYSRMLGKVSEFNKIRTENAVLEKRLRSLQERAAEADVQLASLGSLASEVSIAFGIRRSFTGGSGADQGFSPVRNCSKRCPAQSGGRNGRTEDHRGARRRAWAEAGRI